MEKHTPGPWHQDLHEPCIVRDSEGNFIADTLHPIEDQKDKCLGNACLIATAPELLEALEGLYNKGWTKEAIIRARKAIIKAKGLQA